MAEPREWIRERLPGVISDAELIRNCNAIVERYEAMVMAETDRVLVHTDLGFHNMAMDMDSLTINGLFDYDSAAWADRHLDFRFLVFDLDRYEMLDAARAVYEPLTGARISHERVLLYNMAVAVSYLALRDAQKPNEKSAGRTLEEDLNWVRHGLAKLRATGGSATVDVT